MKSFFVKRYRQLGGSATRIHLPSTLRVNTTKTDHRTLLTRLHSQGIVCERIPWLMHGYTISRKRVSPGATTEYVRGLYYLQETAAQIPVEVLNPQPGEKVLDCCAAPGGKTTQLAQWMKNTGTIIAYELKTHRLPSIAVNLERMGVTNTTVYKGDVTTCTLQGFDKILVDAPCSGNYAADPTWFDKRTYEGIKKSSAIQRRIMKHVVSLLKPNGLLVYATCSLEPEENEMIINWALQTLPVTVEKIPTRIPGDNGIINPFGVKLLPAVRKCKRLWPYKTNTQGFFIALMRKHG